MENLKSILIIDDGAKSASSEIWRDGLLLWLKKLGYKSELSKNVLDGYPVAIFCKGCSPELLKEAKKKGILTGIIDKPLHSLPSWASKYIDFVIVGSIEARNGFLRYYRNVFVLPPIPSKFSGRKMHSEKEDLVLGCHGGTPHLLEMHPNITSAINEFSKETQVKLLVVHGKEDREWRDLMPNIEIDSRRWKRESVQRDLLECDIGIVPGVKPLSCRESISRFRHSKHGYAMYYKETSNANRAFVFVELGIPVISDFIPSCFHLFGDMKSGFLAHNKESWLNALRKLRSHEVRSQVSRTALFRYKEMYNPLIWTKNLCDDIEKLVIKQRNLK